MKTNLLVALFNLISSPITNISVNYRSANRVNSMGDTLEFYIKDLFCGSINEKDLNKKNKIYNEFFSYIGNQNNPPDIMIKGGDAIEVKKIASFGSGIALNSSYPKDKLFSDSPMITNECRNCENWKEKDLIYIIGIINQKKLKSLWLIYGNCYAADKEIYERISNKISDGVNQLPGVEFSETNELARINKVDPLGITYLRVRGMWGIENPLKVFSYVVPSNSEYEFSINAIMLKEKYLSFPQQDRVNIEKLIVPNFSIKDIKIKSPNNPAKLLEAKLISFNK